MFSATSAPRSSSAPLIPVTVDRLRERGLLAESDGAQVDVEIRDDGRLVLIEEDDDTDARVGE